jgi:hypothetical protein
MPKPANAGGAFIGFDQGDYPGDASMQDWWNNSPYQFCAYYLTAPCHTAAFTAWEGTRTYLVGLGWSLLLVYVGQQRPGNNCGQNTLTAAQGLADAIDATNRTTNNGFPAGTYIYLDIEGGGPFGADLTAYLSGWVPQILATGFGVGIYCSRRMPNDVQAYVLTQYPAGANASPRFWLAGDDVPAQFNRATSVPSDAAANLPQPFPGATAWQSLSANQTWGASTLNVDESVSILVDPSAP